MSTQPVIALCPQCQLKPKWPGMDYCGKTCATDAKQSQPTTVTSPNDLCPQCQLKPKWTGMDYCGKTCAKQASLLSPTLQASPIKRASIGIVSNSTSTAFPQININIGGTTPKCSLHGCSNNCSVDSRGGFFDFCGKTCASKKCKTTSCFNLKGQSLDYCGTCTNNGTAIASTISSKSTGFKKLQATHPSYVSVEDQFKKKWLHPTSVPTVKAIFKIRPPTSLKSNYESYQQTISQQVKKVMNNAGTGNALRRFHGTSLNCDLLNTCSPCSVKGCGICGIFQNGWLLKYSKSFTGAARYGDGIYFSATSSKSNDYARTNQSYKAMFLGHVVAGNVYSAPSSVWGPVTLPSGTHSCLGDPKVDNQLNYDELVVYDEKACLPGYVILYQ